jgi:hypothetical protein
MPVAAQVVIDRVLVDPSGNENSNSISEVVVLKNMGIEAIDLSGWVLRSTPPLEEPDQDGARRDHAGLKWRARNLWYTRTDVAVGTIAGVPTLLTPIATGKNSVSLLNNDGGDLGLYHSADVMVHYVQWSDSALGLEAAAGEAGVWTAGITIDRPDEDHWLIYDGEGFEVSDWSIGPIVESPTPTAVTPVPWGRLKTEID